MCVDQDGGAYGSSRGASLLPVVVPVGVVPVVVAHRKGARTPHPHPALHPGKLLGNPLGGEKPAPAEGRGVARSLSIMQRLSTRECEVPIS